LLLLIELEKQGIPWDRDQCLNKIRELEILEKDLFEKVDGFLKDSVFGEDQKKRLRKQFSKNFLLEEGDDFEAFWNKKREELVQIGEEFYELFSPYLKNYLRLNVLKSELEQAYHHEGVLEKQRFFQGILKFLGLLERSVVLLLF
jgi:hypothetical protein